MSPPCDYPLGNDATHTGSAVSHDVPTGTPLTVAVLFERHRASLPITDAMIDDACRTLRAAESVLEN